MNLYPRQSLSRIRAVALKWVAESPSTRNPELILYIWRRFGFLKAVGVNIYDGAFFKEHEEAEMAYADLASIIHSLFRPDSVCDFGCGNAFIIHHLKQQGVTVKGVDCSSEALPHIPPAVRNDVTIGSVTQTLSLGRFDLVLSTEVAEHIPRNKSATFVMNLATHALRGVIFTAAAPGQWGDGHINCQPKSYWQELFYRHGWSPNESLTAQFVESIRCNPRIDTFLPWIRRNLIVFTPCSDRSQVPLGLRPDYQ